MTVIEYGAGFLAALAFVAFLHHTPSRNRKDPR